MLWSRQKSSPGCFSSQIHLRGPDLSAAHKISEIVLFGLLAAARFTNDKLYRQNNSYARCGRCPLNPVQQQAGRSASQLRHRLPNSCCRWRYKRVEVKIIKSDECDITRYANA